MKRKKHNSLKGSGIRIVAAVVCDRLTGEGYDPVLTGRACAAIYGEAQVKANSIDFVVSEYVVEDVERIMKDLGFSCRLHRTFASKQSPFEVTFLPPPLSVGDEVVRDVRVLKTTRGALRMLMPTDCVRQRLSTYYRFGEDIALDDAVAVAKLHEIDLDLVERWSHWEWASDKFEEFRRRLKS